MPPRSKTTKKKTAGDVESIINAALLPALATKAASSPTKRKALVLSDSEFSGIEIIDTPHPSPKKARPATPPPGTSAFNNLPAVTFSESIEGNVVATSTDIAFGSTRSGRTRTRTSKAILLDEEKAGKLSQKNKKMTSGKSVAVLDDSPVGSLMYPASVLSGESMKLLNKSLSPELTRTLIPNDEQKSYLFEGDKNITPLNYDYFGSDDELPEVSELALVTPQKRKPIVSDPATVANTRIAQPKFLDVEAVDSANESTHSDNGSDCYLDTDNDGSVGLDQEEESDIAIDSVETMRPATPCPPNTYISADNSSNDPDAVTSVIYQDTDPNLRAFYQRLPYLDRLREIKPFKAKILTTFRLGISKVLKTLNSSEANSLIRGLTFVQSGYFVNFATIDPSLLQQEQDRIRMAHPGGSLAVGLFTGLCTQGFIIKTDLIGPQNSPYEVHGITVAGSDQDTRRYMSLVGTVFGYEKITGCMTGLGLSFYTRGDGKNGSFASSSYSAQPLPPTPSPAISSLLHSVALPSAMGTARSYPASRSFDDRIPVYDGREKKGRHFMFTDADFRDLPNWPLYRRGEHEIEEGTIVSVGHTLGTYYGSQGGRCLSTNIHFVIVLGKPAQGLVQHE